MTACFDEYRKHSIDPTAVPIPSGLLSRMRLIRMTKNYDAIIIQKKTSFRLLELKAIKRLNKNIVFDMDDAVMFHELEHHKPLSGKNFIKFVRTINHCRAIVAGNSTLAKYSEANCGIVRTLPTPIDLNRYQPKEYIDIDIDTAPVTIGWIGVAGSLHFLKLSL